MLMVLLLIACDGNQRFADPVEANSRRKDESSVVQRSAQRQGQRTDGQHQRSSSSHATKPRCEQKHKTMKELHCGNDRTKDSVRSRFPGKDADGAAASVDDGWLQDGQIPIRFDSLKCLYVVSMESCQENLSWIRM